MLTRGYSNNKQSPSHHHFHRSHRWCVSHSQSCRNARISEPLQRVLLHRPGAVLWRHVDPADPRLWKNPWKRWKIHGNVGQIHGKFGQIHGKFGQIHGKIMKNPWIF